MIIILIIILMIIIVIIIFLKLRFHIIHLLNAIISLTEIGNVQLAVRVTK